MKSQRTGIVCILVTMLTFVSGCGPKSSSNTEQGFPSSSGESASYLGSEPIATNQNPVFLTTRALPFPSDLFAKTDPSTPTGIRLTITNGLFNPDIRLIPHQLYPENVYADADGYSAGTPILFELDGPIAPDTLPADGGEVVVAYDYLTGERVPLNVKMSQVAQHEVQTVKGSAVQAIPRARLVYGHRYVVYVTKGLRRKDGSLFTCSPGFEKAKAKEAAGAVARFYAPHLEFLEKKGVPRDDLLCATVFTVRSRENAMGPLPDFARHTYSQDLGVQINKIVPWPNPLDNIAAKVFGQVEVMRYRDADSEMDLDPRKNKGTKEWVDFILFIPCSAGVKPAPVCIYGHAYRMFKETAIFWAMNNASVGVATIAIDLIGHGLMSKRDGWDGSEIDEPNYSEAWKFFSLVMGAPLDHLALLKALQTSPVFKDLDIMTPAPLYLGVGDGKPDLDTSRIIYQGTSLGAIAGTTFSALAPRLMGAYVHVGGSNWSYFFNDGWRRDAYCACKPESFTGAETASIIAAWQALWDRVDNLNYLDNLRHGMMIPASGDEPSLNVEPHPHAMVYATGDTTVIPLSSLTMAEVLGLPLLPPVINDAAYLEHADDFINGFGVLQLDPIQIDLSALDPIFQTDVTGRLHHLMGGLHPQAMASQRAWMKQVLFAN